MASALSAAKGVLYHVDVLSFILRMLQIRKYFTPFALMLVSCRFVSTSFEAHVQTCAADTENL